MARPGTIRQGWILFMMSRSHLSKRQPYVQRTGYELSQKNPAIHYVGTPYTVGADLSRTPPIDRPGVDVPLSG